MNEPDGPRVEHSGPSPWGLLAFGLGMLVGLTLLVAEVVDPPVWVMWAVVGALLVGILLSVPLAYRDARRQGRSRSGSAWRALTEPVRYLVRWTF
ncbi:hypothetical protein [Cellulomonas sp. P5_C6]